MKVKRIIEEESNYKIKDIGKDKYLVNGNLFYKFKTNDIYLVHKAGIGEFIIICYDSESKLSFFDHIEFKDKVNVINSFTFKLSPAIYMEGVKYPTDLNLNKDVYVLNNKCGKDIIYNSKLRVYEEADRIDDEDDYEIGLSNIHNVYCERYLKDKDTGYKDTIYYYLNIDNMETNVISSSFTDDCVFLKDLYDVDDPDADMDFDEFEDDDDYIFDYDLDNSVNVNDLISLDYEIETLDEREKYEYKFNTALKYLENRFKEKCKKKNKIYVKR